MPVLGVNTLFDANQYGLPGMPGAPKDRGYGDFQTFDNSPMANRLISQLNASTGQQQAKAAARASKLGVGRSSSTAGQMENIAADTENRIGQVEQQNALDSWKDLVQQKQFAEGLDANKFGTQMGGYKTNVEANQREQEARQNALFKLLAGVGSFLS